MENNYNDGFVNDLKKEPARPQFLSVLCVLTFIWSGIMILGYGILACCLAFGEETANMFVERMTESNPTINISDPAEFCKQIGMVGVLGLLAKTVTLIGAIMMWKLNKIGFFLYIAAELSTYFFGLDINASTEEGKSYGFLIFTIILDLIFVGMYALNLKHMNKERLNNNVA
ncbi:MAG: hypothetical protein K0S32_1673 [Bacteroidetes bacterium]|jgi:hypothetical protein|nr:hypothetical protein [Bacteroidota bacterium]